MAEEKEKKQEQPDVKPFEINGQTVGYIDKNGNFAFFHNDTKDSPLSNAYVSNKGFNLYFKDHKMSAENKEGSKPYHFYSVDQAMAFGKAITMGDMETAAKVYNLKPNIAKKFPNAFDDLTKDIKNYDQNRWDKAKDKWMVTSMQAKFEQDPQAKKTLQAAMNYNVMEIDKPKGKLSLKKIGQAIKTAKDKYKTFKKNVMKTAKKMGFIEVDEKPIDRTLQNMFLNDGWRPFGENHPPKQPKDPAQFAW